MSKHDARMVTVLAVMLILFWVQLSVLKSRVVEPVETMVRRTDVIERSMMNGLSDSTIRLVQEKLSNAKSRSVTQR